MMNFLPLLGLTLCSCRPATEPASTIQIDATKTTAISPYVYGLNFPEWEKIGLPFPLARQGGNRMTAYNWETNASNAGNDYRNQNDDYLGKSDEAGWTIKNFLEPTQSHGAACLITIPTLGYVSADKGPDDDVKKTPDYLNVRFLKSYARKPGVTYGYPPDTTDKAVYQDECVAWIKRIQSNATPVWFALDNEPDIWAGTHSRICLTKPTYASIIANNIEFASAIKNVYGRTLVFGPVHYGWMGVHNFQDATDANGRAFPDVYLDAMKAAEAKQGRRVLDVYDFHYYPEAQGDNTRVTENKDSAGVYAARIQAPRSLWDAAYIEKSWITQANGGKPIRMIPELQERIQTHYPGTKLGITEYNFGGNNHISGALAQADALGIFGRYGVFAACNWGMSPNDKAEIAGFRAFLNFDGKGGRFADLGLSVSGEDPAANSVYASRDSKNRKRLTLVVINKTDKGRTESLALKGFKPKSAKSFTIAGSEFERAEAGAPDIRGGLVVLTMPPYSIASIEIAG